MMNSYQPGLPKPTRKLKEPSVLRSKKPLRRVNPERKAAKFERNFGAHRDFIVALPCAVRLSRSGGLPVVHSFDRAGRARNPSLRNPFSIVSAHVQAIGMGGAKGSWRDLVPLSADLHLSQHRLGLAEFERRFEVSLRALRHVLVVADPDVEPSEQLAAWDRLHQQHTPEEVREALQRGYDLTGRAIVPPRGEA